MSVGGVTLNLGDTDATPAFNLSDATAYPYTSLTGITTEIVGDTTPQLGGNLDINSKFITGTGGINVTGVVTATTFDGNVTGNITGDVSGNAGTATSLSSARNFSITGDVVASAVSFDGTGNVVLSTAIQPNSVALATDTTGDFVQSITGTTNEVTVSATSGENSTPQIGLPNDVTIGQDLTVTRNIDVDGHTELDDVNVSGALTATSLNVTDKLTTTGIGISIANGAGNTAYIEGPSEIWIDPHPFGVGQTSGSVRIRGDLYVDGTEFIVDVDKIELGDFNIGIASTVSTNSLLDGAGLGIGATSIRKFITWNNATSALMSSENWNLASGKHYEIDGTDVLTSDTLGSGVINSSLTSVGTLGALTVSGNVNANGNIIGDGATNISGINSVTATLFYGSGANLTSIPNGALTNSSIAIGGVTLNLGDTDATPAFNLSDATAYPTSSLVGTITNAQLAGSIADDKLASTFLKNVVEDTTPQLGGNLDFNSKFITGTGGINVTGVVTATTFSGNLPTSDLTGTITNAQLAGSIANAKLVNDSVSFGGVSVDLGASDATPAFDLSDATAYPTSSLVGTITNAQLAGSIADDKLASTFLKNVVEDTTPQLGGNLDFNSKFITGTGGINVTGVVTATSFVGSSAVVGSGVTINSNGLNITGVVTATSFVGSSAVVGSGVTINSNGLNITGVVTATSFTGSGSALTGLTGASAATYGDASNVAQIVVNSDGKITGISEVTISGGGGSSGISSVGIQSGGTPVGAGATLMNFVGTGITMSATEGLIDIHIPVATRTTTRTVATNAQTTFSATYTVGYVDVYLNGSKLDINEFTATNGTSVVLGTGASTDDIVEIVAQNVTAAVDLNGLANVVDDTSPQLGGNLDINDKFITGTGGINVTGVVTATSFVGSSAVVGSGVTINSNGLNITGVVTATSFVGNVTGNADTATSATTATTATTATNTTVADESSDTSCFPLFVTAATGDLPP